MRNTDPQHFTSMLDIRATQSIIINGKFSVLCLHISLAVPLSIPAFLSTTYVYPYVKLSGPLADVTCCSPVLRV